MALSYTSTGGPKKGTTYQGMAQMPTDGKMPTGKALAVAKRPDSTSVTYWQLADDRDAFATLLQYYADQELKEEVKIALFRRP